MFEKCWFKLSDFDPANGMQPGAIKAAATNFHSNISRVHQLIGLIPRMIGIGMRQQLAETLAIFEATQGLTLSTDQYRDSALMQRITTRQMEIVSNAEMREVLNPEQLKSFYGKSSKTMLQILERFEMKGAPVIESLLINMLVNAWVAFEILVEELYRAATEEKDTRSFFKFEDAIKAYKSFFSTSSPRVLNAIDSPAPKALFRLRNLFMHNNGIIDQRFMDRSAGIVALERFRSLGLGARVQCAGSMIPEFLAPVISIACEIIMAVKEWCVLRQK